MSSFLESRGFRFVWKIDNFSCLKGENFVSPFFHALSEKWVISITHKNSNLFFCIRDFENPIGYFYCSFSLLDSDGMPLMCKEKKIAYDVTLFEFPNESYLFPSNTLKVECRVWLPSDSYGESCGLLSPVSRFCLTRVEPVSKSIKRSFQFDVLRLSRNYEESATSEFKAIICGAKNLEIKIELPSGGPISVKLETTLFGFQAKIKVYVLDTSGNKIEFGNHNAKFVSKVRSCEFNLDISKAILLCYSHKYLPSGTLSLVFTCTFSGHFSYDSSVEDSSEIIDTPSTTTPAICEISKIEAAAENHETSHAKETNGPKTITQTLQDMFSEGYLSDFNLKVGNRAFPVHKNILGMRSKVFKAMFDSEMKETLDNSVDIKDVDADTLHRMLQFIYSDKLDKDLDWAEASSLYAAADFYALEPLKQGCAEILIDGLSSTSALGVLFLADLHQDRQLKSASLDFIWLNDRDVVGTEDWIKFEKENCLLALETFRELYLRKMNE